MTPNAVIHGVKIFVSPLATRQVQAKVHKRNKRINKKWLKKFGTKTVDQMLYTAGGVYVSQRVWDALKIQVLPSDGKITGRSADKVLVDEAQFCEPSLWWTCQETIEDRTVKFGPKHFEYEMFRAYFSGDQWHHSIINKITSKATE